MNKSEQLLNWLNKEKSKDQIQLSKEKERLVNEIKKLQKSEIFPQPKKLTIWQKLKIMILGR
jgi:hypothetical protein